MSKKIKVLMAGKDMDLMKSAEEYLTSDGRFEICGSLNDSGKVVHRAKESGAEVVLLGEMVSTKSGESIANEIRRTSVGVYPKIMLISHKKTAAPECVDDCLHLPIMMCEMAERTADLISFGGEINKRIKDIVQKELCEFRFPVHYKGYQYLSEAIMRGIREPRLLKKITKEIYPGIAEKYNATAYGVERAVRGSIGEAWLRGGIDVMSEKYGCRFFTKPKNGEFIATLAEYLRRDKRICNLLS